MEQFSRTELLLGKENMDKLKSACIAVFGLGGVGSYVCEALARCGIGKFILIDNDTVHETNINRQLIADITTIGKAKTDVMRDRILKINPQCQINVYQEFYLPGKNDEIITKDVDYIVDAIDTVSGKIGLILRADEIDIPIISCMGTGNKLDASQFIIDDIYNTSVCPLARVMRRELKARGVKKCKVLYSREEPKKGSAGYSEDGVSKRTTPASIAFVPSVAGLLIAGEVIRDLTQFSVN